MDPTIAVAIISAASVVSVGLLGVIGARRSSDRDRLSAELAERRRLEARDRTWDDYTIELRRQIQEAGGTPAEYPAELRKG